MTVRVKKPIDEMPARRLWYLMKGKGIKQSDLVKSGCVMHRSMISEILSCKRPLTESQAKKIADVFFPDINLAWIFGKTNVKYKPGVVHDDLFDISRYGPVTDRILNAIRQIVDPDEMADALEALGRWNKDELTDGLVSTHVCVKSRRFTYDSNCVFGIGLIKCMMPNGELKTFGIDYNYDSVRKLKELCDAILETEGVYHEENEEA